MKVVALTGGTGSAKLLRGLSPFGSALTVVANIGDNIWMHGLYVCPDIDIAMYTLAGIADRERGWGIQGDTFNVLAQLKREGEATWFALGDMDIATSILRTKLLREGKTLTEVTKVLSKSLSVDPRILPATDQPVETYLKTSAGSIHLQEFWVRRRGRPRVLGVNYRGASHSRPTAEVEGAIRAADRIVICPGNPVTSMGPMLSVPGFAKLLSKAGGRVTALSPLVGSAPFSGPAAKLMKAVGIRPDSVGVAQKYSRFLDVIVMAQSDVGLSREIEGLGVKCRLSDTRIRGPADERRLARELVEA